MGFCAPIAAMSLPPLMALIIRQLTKREITEAILQQVNVMKYTPSFSAMALRTGMTEVKELDGLLSPIAAMFLPPLMALKKRIAKKGKLRN